MRSNHTCWTIYLLVTLLVCWQPILAKKSQKKTRKNAQAKTKLHKPKPILNIPLSKLETAVKKKANAVVLFTKKGHEDDAKVTSVFKKITDILKHRDITFFRVDLSQSESMSSSFAEDQEISIYYYVHGHRRHFNGQLNTDDLLLWIRGVYEAKPFKISKITHIEPADKHYLVHASMNWVMRNQFRMKTLSKLLSPLGIYTGLNKKQILELTGVQVNTVKTPLWTFRDYDRKIIPISTRLSIDEQVKEILTQEIPEHAECNEKGLVLIQDTKIPVLAYFKPKEQNLDQWNKVLELAKHYKEYLMPILVNSDNNDLCTQFMKNYLEVEKSPALRILVIADNVKRFAHIGNFEENSLKFFFHNYVNGNLRPYSINEKLQKNENYRGLAKMNSKRLKDLKKGSNTDQLIYVFNKSATDHDEDFAELMALQAELAEQNRFKIYAFDHDKNDLDRSFNHLHLPFVFFVTSQGKMLGYKGKITKAALLKHINQLFKYTNIEEQITDL